MNFGFWGNLKKPFFALAPMADVTDFAFREVVSKYSKPDVMFTEFVSCDGLCSNGKEKLMHCLKFTKKQKPIVAQFFGSKPENFYKCAVLAQELGFDGIDINMGCPDKSVLKQKAGAELIKNPDLAKKIIYETKRGAGKLPISVKTRLGYNTDILEEWIPHIFETEPAVLILHCRTKKEMSKTEAKWKRIETAVEIRNKYFSKSKYKTLIVGNGDIKSVKEGLEKAKKYGVDGVMVGRGVFGNPLFFKGEEINLKNKLKIMAEHAKIFEKEFYDRKDGKWIKKFDTMKKHFKSYCSGFKGANFLRQELMKTKSSKEVMILVSKFKYEA